MLFERVESEGLAHYSYIIGDKNEAAIIDPRRDCEVYVDRAVRSGYKITHIFETHRNEDFVAGSIELATRTGAEIWHADSQLAYRCGKPAGDGQTWKVGRLEIEAIPTPGHTPGSMSYLLRTPDGGEWAVFTGDTLFAGDVGRVDLPGIDKMHESAGLLYDSLFKRLLPLGDELIVCPGHGPGSVCGTAIADRTWTTIGLERRLNPRLRFRDRNEFIEGVARELERPPYFRMMERLNLEGAPILGALPVPKPLSVDDFTEAAKQGVILDTRSDLAFGAAHIPGSLFIWEGGVPSYAGWLLTYDTPILLVGDSGYPAQTVRYLVRLGYDRLEGYLAGGMLGWHMAGYESSAVRMLTVQELCRQLDEDRTPWILDVRATEELDADGVIPNANHIHITLLPDRLAGVPRDREVFIFCGSGLRSMIAAGLLQRAGWKDLCVVLGGLAGWSSRTCPLEQTGP